MDLRTLALLLVCNLIWSANPVFSKLILRSFDVPHAAWLRYVSAFVAYLLFVLVSRRRQEAFVVPRKAKEFLFLGLLGILTFTISPVLQMAGLSASRAIDGPLVVAMEPLLAIFLAWLFLREPLGIAQAFSFVAALFGFVLLADITPSQNIWEGRTLGNLLLLFSIFCEASYSVMGRSLMARYPAVPVFGSILAFGVLILVAITWVWTGTLVPDFSRLTWIGALAVLWLGPLGTMASYLYWMDALRRAPVATVVITLLIQPVFGTLWGSLFLGERMTLIQGVGAALIIAAVFHRFLISAGMNAGRALLGAPRQAENDSAPSAAKQ